jgi:hypothetical protein
MTSVFWEYQRVSFIPATYYLKLLKDQPYIQNDEVDQSKASVSTTKTRVRTPPL